MSSARSVTGTKARSNTGSDTGFASLGPTLLARKVGAKPAMRPQLAPLPEVGPIDTDSLEDLGWNDMGEASPGSPSGPGGHAPRKTKTKAKPKPKSSKTTKDSKKSAATKADAKADKRRAAFTLRLDSDRHLKLRLAATMHGMSAQALVTDAIDAMFGEIEDLDALANRMKRN